MPATVRVWDVQVQQVREAGGWRAPWRSRSRLQKHGRAVTNESTQKHATLAMFKGPGLMQLVCEKASLDLDGPYRSYWLGSDSTPMLAGTFHTGQCESEPSHKQALPALSDTAACLSARLRATSHGAPNVGLM